MRRRGRLAVTCLFWLLIASPIVAQPEAKSGGDSKPLDWPTVTREMRPWTRWWWLGSAVDKKNISRELQTLHDAGLGGVEITCLYGVRGADSRQVPYLSDLWVDDVRHTLREAKRLDIGVDLPTGSGWRMGGPSVTDADADLAIVISGDPPAITSKWAKDNVKRPAPGGEGKSINPYSRPALDHYLDHFGKAIDGLPAEGIRAQFHDSFEYDGNWCEDFLAQFEKRRGYRLEDHAAALAGEGDADKVARVKCDYRETLSDLVYDNLIVPWVAWSHANGMLARNQSHGSPSNWLDLYAACDIPEIEHFGRLGDSASERLVFQFASSAAHVAGRPLASSETCTWLDEHFQETLAEMKELVDRLFLAGVNHVIYHGTAYSPDDAAWPGWLFYASSEINPRNPVWRDLPALNEYITRCQSILQTTQPDNDILLYWPIYDTWQDARGLRQRTQVENVAEWFHPSSFGQTAHWLEDQGYTFDYVSDRQLSECKSNGGMIHAVGAAYGEVVVPKTERMPLKTLKTLLALVQDGASVVFIGDLPIGPPGLKGVEEQPEWDQLVRTLSFESGINGTVRIARPGRGRGRVLIVPNLSAVLGDTYIRREAWRHADGLAFNRRSWSGGHVYFIKNEADHRFDGQIVPEVDWRRAAILDPASGLVGLAESTKAEPPNNAEEFGIRLQLAPRQAVFVKTFREAVAGPAWPYREVAGDPMPLDGAWKVEFVTGGPKLPATFETHRLASWTELAGDDGQNFAGTARYSISLKPDVRAGHYLLDLGSVADSARVMVNDKTVATLISPPYQVEIGPLRDGDNQLAIEVTNVAANRIRDLDRRGIKWKIFKDINFVDIKYKPFDASQWPVRDAGLLGPVTLTPLSVSAK